MGKKKKNGFNRLRELHISVRLAIGIVLACSLTGVLYYSRIQKYNSICAYNAYEQATTFMAEGNYEKAIQLFYTAYKYTSEYQDDIIIYLADAYIQLEEYDEAVELLQSYYDKTKLVSIRKKLNDTVDDMIQYEYTMNIERGKKYEQNREYKKAIQEYSKAYRLQPESSEALEYIIDTSILNADIEYAKKILNECKDQHTNTIVNKLAQKIVQAELKMQYNRLLDEADELFLNESYPECFQKYEEAIQKMPYEIEAYTLLANTYIKLQKYEQAIERIKQYKNAYQYGKLQETLRWIKEEKKKDETLVVLLKKLYDECISLDTDIIYETVHSKQYKKNINEGTTYYYNAITKRVTTKIPVNKGLIIYGSGAIYAGEFYKGKRNGTGAYYIQTDDSLKHAFYHGYWRNDLPNGEGDLISVRKLTIMDELKEYVVTVKGNYKNGYEHGIMKGSISLETISYGSFHYVCVEGIPQPVHPKYPYNEKQNGLTYTIGEVNTDEGMIVVQYKKTDDLWKVPGL